MPNRIKAQSEPSLPSATINLVSVNVKLEKVSKIMCHKTCLLLFRRLSPFLRRRKVNRLGSFLLLNMLAFLLAASVASGQEARLPRALPPDSWMILNTVGIDGSGLCTWTALAQLGTYLGHSGMAEMLQEMRRREGGGWPERVDRDLPRLLPNVPYWQARCSDLQIADAMLSKGIPVVTYVSRGTKDAKAIHHSVLLVHLDQSSACVLDSRYKGREGLEWMTRAEFSQRSVQPDGLMWLIGMTGELPPPALPKEGRQSKSPFQPPTDYALAASGGVHYPKELGSSVHVPAEQCPGGRCPLPAQKPQPRLWGPATAKYTGKPISEAAELIAESIASSSPQAWATTSKGSEWFSEQGFDKQELFQEIADKFQVLKIFESESDDWRSKRLSSRLTHGCQFVLVSKEGKVFTAGDSSPSNNVQKLEGMAEEIGITIRARKPASKKKEEEEVPEAKRRPLEIAPVLRKEAEKVAEGFLEMVTMIKFHVKVLYFLILSLILFHILKYIIIFFKFMFRFAYTRAERHFQQGGRSTKSLTTGTTGQPTESKKEVA